MGKLRPLVPLWVSKTKASALLSRHQQLLLGETFSATPLFRMVMIREPMSVFNEFMFNKEPNERLPSMSDMFTAMRNGQPAMMDLYHDTVKALEKEGYTVEDNLTMKENAPEQEVDEFLEGAEQAFGMVCEGLVEVGQPDEQANASVRTKALLNTGLADMLTPRLLHEVTIDAQPSEVVSKIDDEIDSGDSNDSTSDSSDAEEEKGDKERQSAKEDIVSSLAEWQLADLY